MATKFEASSQMLAPRVALSPSFNTSVPIQGKVIKHIADLNRRLNKPTVCLTFDDGPDPVYTPLILDILREQKILASFFVMGEAALHMPKVVGRIVDAGHTIGNHTYNHNHPWQGFPEYSRQQVSRATRVIADIAGRAPRWFRPPFGRLRPAMLDQVANENMATVLWSHSIIDWGWCATDAGIARRLNAIRAGDIVLMHDGKRQHNRPDILIRQLPNFLDGLKQRVALLTLDQVISSYYSRRSA